MRSIWALAGKDLTVTRRSPTFLAITVLVPLVFVGLYALLVQVSATSPVAIAQEGTGPHSQRMVQVLKDMSSVDGEFFEIRTTDPDEARRMFDDGEIGAVLTIPADFDRSVEAGRPVSVPLQVFNINSDGTKNFQLRAEHAVRQFAADGGGSLATVKETSAFSEDMRITVYLGTGLLMFAILYASMVNTGTLVAREWEERTAKPLVLSPSATRRSYWASGSRPPCRRWSAWSGCCSGWPGCSTIRCPASAGTACSPWSCSSPTAPASAP